MKSFKLPSAALLCLAAAPVFAASTTCVGDKYGELIPSNLTVPAGQTCRLIGGEVKGNVSVQGRLYSYGTRFDGNVSVTGGVIVMSNGNGMGSALVGNLSITGSSGNNQIGCPNSSNVFLGNISFTGNSGNLYVCQATVISGSVTVSNNTRINNDWSGMYVADLNGIQIQAENKGFTCDGNFSADGSSAIRGSGNTGNTTSCPALTPAAPAN